MVLTQTICRWPNGPKHTWQRGSFPDESAMDVTGGLQRRRVRLPWWGTHLRWVGPAASTNKLIEWNKRDVYGRGIYRLWALVPSREMVRWDWLLFKQVSAVLCASFRPFFVFVSSSPVQFALDSNRPVGRECSPHSSLVTQKAGLFCTFAGCGLMGVSFISHRTLGGQFNKIIQFIIFYFHFFPGLRRCNN